MPETNHSTMARPPRMRHNFHRVAILFAGGPAPGANAVISTAATEILRAQARRGKLPDAAMERLRHLPFEDLGFAKVDHHRALRHGIPEVVFGSDASPMAPATG